MFGSVEALSAAATVFKFRNAPICTSAACAHARKARVPFVVVIAIRRPRTFSGVNSRGELPKSKSTLPVMSARIRCPPRSPASNKVASFARNANASGISETGIISDAPFSKAVSIVVVARRMSNTTQVVVERSRPAKAAYSAGFKITSTRRSWAPLLFVSLTRRPFSPNPPRVNAFGNGGRKNSFSL